MIGQPKCRQLLVMCPKRDISPGHHTEALINPHPSFDSSLIRLHFIISLALCEQKIKVTPNAVKLKYSILNEHQEIRTFNVDFMRMLCEIFTVRNEVGAM